MIKELISQSKKIIITCHANPDGDAIGSSLAMYHYLKKKELEVYVIVPNRFPSFLSWLPGNEEIIFYNESKIRSKSLIKEADLIFCLDFNTLKRLEGLRSPVEKSEAKKILIDHHLQPNREQFDYIRSRTTTSSTAELIYEFIFEMGDQALLNKEIAECIYTGIITDTGSFSFACNHESTYLVTAALINLGVDGEYIHRLVYDTYSEDRMRLLGYSLSNKLIILKELHTAYICLSKEDLNRFNYQVGDTEGLVNYALSIKGVHLAILITERDSFIRLSFRSKGSFSVNELASKYFKGGGHRNAAGGNSYISMDKTIEKLEKLLEYYKDDLKRAMD